MTIQNQQGLPPLYWKLEDFLACTVACVESTAMETRSLWKEHSAKLNWEPQTYSFFVDAGVCVLQTAEKDEEMYVVLSLLFQRINGRFVLFYEATSIVVDHRMVDKWLDTKLPHLKRPADFHRAGSCNLSGLEQLTQTGAGEILAA